MPPSPRFENYEVLQREDGTAHELGRGAMGVTYKAHDVDLHCDVALKVINPALIGGPEARERFLREARAAAKFRHPNIASVFRLGKTEDDTHYYAMEFCEGPTLEQAVRERGAIPAAEAVWLAWQVSKALMLAEQHQFVHRDLKPANLILTHSHDEGTVVKVIDFGLAKSFADGMQTLATMSTSGFAGTAHFASPEQLEERDLDIRSDIYSLGTCLWFMLTGKPPFEGPLARVMSQTLSAEPPWEKLSGQPPAVVALLRRMLSKQPAGRPESAAALKADLEACLQAIQHPDQAVEAGVPAAPPPTDTGMSFEQRFDVVETLGQDGIGRLYRGSDAARRGAAVVLRVIDPGLTAVPAVRRELEAQLSVARENPHPNLLAPIAFSHGDGSLLVATDWTDGFTLLDLLRQRGTLTPNEALALLGPLAAAADHAARHGVTGLNLSKDQIVIHFPPSYERAAAAELVAKPVEEWPGHVVKAGTLSVGDHASHGDGHATMATIAPAVSTAGHPLAAVQAVAQIACEMLGGRGGASFAPLPKLSEAGNAVLRRAFGDPGSFTNAAALVGELAGTLSAAPPVAAPAPASQAPAPSPAKPAASRGSAARRLASAAAVMLVLSGAGAGYYFGIQQPRERDRKKRADAAEQSPVTPLASLPATPAAPSPQAVDPFAEGPVPPVPAPAAGVATVPRIADPAEWEDLADDGDAFAQALLGERLITATDSTDRDHEKGISWLKKSADQDHPLGTFLHAEQQMLRAGGGPPGNRQPPNSAPFREAFFKAFDLGLAKEAPGGGIAWSAALGRAYDQGLGTRADPGRALQCLEAAAGQGHAWSQFVLGEIHEHGRGTKKNRLAAVTWYERSAAAGWPAARASLVRLGGSAPLPLQEPETAREWAAKAAKTGDPVGRVAVGLFLEQGIGGLPDAREALTWYELAAGKGNATAKAHLGRMLLEGTVISADDPRAFKLLKEAVAGGCMEACSDLGAMFESGRGGEKSLSTAVDYYRQGAGAGDLRSITSLGLCMEEGRGLPQDSKEAVNHYREAADAGLKEAQYRLGLALQSGKGVPRDPRKAAGYLEGAARQKLTAALFEWGKCLEAGNGVPKNEAESFRSYEQAAEAGHAAATFRAGLMLEDGRGTRKDEALAVKRYTTAANNGDPSAQVNLGLMYARGIGVAKSDARAVEWYRKAAAQGDADGLVLLGMMCEFGHGTKRDPAEAARHYRQAASKGDKQARILLENLKS